jgi:acetolactate synthase-1/2/3 large subunit
MKLADAYGIPGFRVDRVEDLETTLTKAAAITDRPVLVELRVDPEEMVFPMVPSGASNDEVVESADEWYARQLAAAGQEL